MKQDLIQNIVLSGLLCLSLAFPRVALRRTRVFSPWRSPAAACPSSAPSVDGDALPLGCHLQPSPKVKYRGIFITCFKTMHCADDFNDCSKRIAF